MFRWNFVLGQMLLIRYEYSNLRVLEDGPYDEMLVSCFQGIDMGPGLTMIMTSRYT